MGPQRSRPVRQLVVRPRQGSHERIVRNVRQPGQRIGLRYVFRLRQHVGQFVRPVLVGVRQRFGRRPRILVDRRVGYEFAARLGLVVGDQ